MKNFRRYIIAGLAMGFLVNFPENSPAQQPPARTPTRQQKIQEHQERIRRILEESNRRKQEAGQQQSGTPPAAPGDPAIQPAPAQQQAQPAPQPGQAAPTNVQPGQPVPTGPIQNARMTPSAQQATPTPAAAPPQQARSESRTILLFHPLDSLVKVGDHFKTDLIAETKEGEIDEVSIFLRYPRHVLSPLALDHSDLDPHVKDRIDYEFNPDEGTIWLRTTLKEPTRFAQAPVISIIWEALEQSEGAVISYEFGDAPRTTALYLKGTDLLGTLPGAQDGVIRTTVQVIGPEEKPTITELESNDLMIGARPPATFDDRPEERISVEMRAPNRTVRAGESFDVGVFIRNNGEKRMDRLRLYLQFDPTVLQVEDFDTGNVVTRGININDADARENFPFEYYRANEADNSKGTIIYEVSAANTHVRGSGRIATVRMKALKETSRAQLVMVQNAQGLSPTTSISFMGEAQLATASPGDTARAINGVAIRVEGVAVASEASEESDIYNPFVSNLARRMREAGQ